MALGAHGTPSSPSRTGNSSTATGRTTSSGTQRYSLVYTLYMSSYVMWAISLLKTSQLV